MKVTVLQENLARGLNTVSRAVSPRSTLPVLANVMIATDEGRLRLSATNLSYPGVRQNVRCRIAPLRVLTDGGGLLSEADAVRQAGAGRAGQAR